jgi:hypothetical protein
MGGQETEYRPREIWAYLIFIVNAIAEDPPGEYVLIQNPNPPGGGPGLTMGFKLIVFTYQQRRSTEMGNIILDQPEQIAAAQVLALRGALKLEARGMKRRGRSALSIARDRGLTKKRTAAGALADVNAYIAQNYNL